MIGCNVTDDVLDAVEQIIASDLSEADDHQVRRCLVDYLGCVVGGSNEIDRVAPVLKVMGSGDSRVLGTSMRTSALGSAFVGGFCSHVLELDDGHRRAMQHLGAPVFSTLLALADKDTSWDSFTKATICGYEIAIALGEALQPQHKLHGFHATGTCGTVGAAVAACVLLGYDKAQTKRAIAAAATSAAGLLEVIGEGSSLKPYNVAHASAAALLAAGMGAGPCDGPVDVLGGRRGFLSDFEGDASRLKFSSERKIHGIYTKPYSACRHCHSPIECTERICEELDFNPEDVADVRVDTYELAVFGHDQQTVLNVSEAKMSTPFGVASVICGKGAYMDAYTQDNVFDEVINSVMGKVRVFADPALTAASPEKRGARVTVILKDGLKRESMIEYPKGEPENAMTDSDLESKTLGLMASAGFNEERGRKILKASWGTRSIDDLKSMCCKE